VHAQEQRRLGPGRPLVVARAGPVRRADLDQAGAKEILRELGYPDTEARRLREQRVI